MTKSSTILCILDGWGLSDRTEGNAVTLAQTPNFDDIMATYPNARLTTFGPEVGLPEGQMGNSEVGHMNIGAGRIVEMDLARIDRIMRSGAFGKLPEVEELIAKSKAASGTVHLMGVLSDGGVHGHLDHMIEAMKVLTNAGLVVKLHLFADGRDVAPMSAQGYLSHLNDSLSDGASIATLTGRYYALDRDNRWERVKIAFDAIAFGQADQFKTAEDALVASRNEGLTDEFIKASVIDNYDGLHDGDTMVMLNYRADRAREILSALRDPAFTAFERDGLANISLAGFTSYSDHHDTFVDAIFTKPELKNTLGDWVAQQGKSQFRIAETEKYPHVTFFLNGGREEPFEGEDRYLAPSPKVATYDLQPEMSAPEVTRELVAAVHRGYDLIVVNFANPDMVGHTGDLEAAMKAVEAVDQGLGDLIAATKETDSKLLVCADHGNCETMIDPETGGPHTAHTTNLVPVVLVNGDGDLRDGKLGDLAPTLLALMGLPQPEDMTGQCLLT